MEKEKNEKDRNDKKNYVTTSISFDQVLLDMAKTRADSLGMSFSEYVCRCLDKETAEGGNFVIKPKPTQEEKDSW